MPNCKSCGTLIPIGATKCVNCEDFLVDDPDDDKDIRDDK